MAPIMAAIGMAESGGESTATNPHDNNGRQTSWGIWQISNGTHNKPVSDILNPDVNAQQAVKKFKVQGLRAWGTYSSGAYKKFLKSNVSPIMTGTTSTAQNAGYSIPGVGTIPSPGDISSDIGKGFAEGLSSLIAPLLNFLLWGVETALGGTLIVMGALIMTGTTSGGKTLALDTAEVVEPEAIPAIEAKKQSISKPAQSQQTSSSDQTKVAHSAAEARGLRLSGFQGKIRHEDHEPTVRVAHSRKEVGEIRRSGYKGKIRHEYK